MLNLCHGKGRFEGCQAEIFLRTLVALTKWILHQPRARKIRRSDFLSLESYFLIPFL